MTNEGLEQDILLKWKSTSGKNGHFHTETKYIAAERMVVHSTRGAVRRLWGLLPAKKVSPPPEMLPIPEEIGTEEVLRRYVRAKKRTWL